MTTIIIFVKATQEVVYTQPVSFGMANGQVDEADFFDLAWEAAVEDQAVDPDNRNQYGFCIQK